MRDTLRLACRDGAREGGDEGMRANDRKYQDDRNTTALSLSLIIFGFKFASLECFSDLKSLSV